MCVCVCVGCVCVLGEGGSFFIYFYFYRAWFARVSDNMRRLSYIMLNTLPLFPEKCAGQSYVVYDSKLCSLWLKAM